MRGGLQGNGAEERPAVKNRYWTLGSHDVVGFVKRLTTNARPYYPRGNARSETLRAFSFEEMKRVLGKMV